MSKNARRAAPRPSSASSASGTAVCPVCGKKVGAWHAGGVHPKCRLKMPQKPERPPAFMSQNGEDLFDPRGIANMGQRRRDEVLRRINTKS